MKLKLIVAALAFCAAPAFAQEGYTPAHVNAQYAARCNAAAYWLARRSADDEQLATVLDSTQRFWRNYLRGQGFSASQTGAATNAERTKLVQEINTLPADAREDHIVGVLVDCNDASAEMQNASAD